MTKNIFVCIVSQKIFFLFRRLMENLLMFVKYSATCEYKKKLYKSKLRIGQGYLAESFGLKFPYFS